MDLREHIYHFVRVLKVNDSKETVFDLELVPQGPDPENGATKKLEHKTQISQNTAAECGTTWRDVRRLRHGENKQDFGVRISAGELEDNVKTARGHAVWSRVSGSIN